jgi:hypothetical protein
MQYTYHIFLLLLQSAEQEYGIAVDQHPGHWESHLGLARLLSTTSSNGVKLKHGYTKGKRLDKVCKSIYKYVYVPPSMPQMKDRELDGLTNRMEIVQN